VLFISLLLTAAQAKAKSAPIIKLSQSAEQVWQRQQVLITLTVKTDDPFSRLEVEPFKQQGFSIVSFGLQRTESSTETTLVLKWVVFPFVAGKHDLKLPRIRYRPNSGRIQTLVLETVALKVRRLPLYVPPTMPVGEISLKSYWREGWLVTTHNLLEWQVMVEGKGVAKQFIPPLSRQLGSSKSIEIMPLEKLDKTHKTVAGISYERQYKVPLKVRQNGFERLPKIEIQYFEPRSGTLQKARLSSPLFIALNKWFLGFIVFLLAIFFSILLYRVVTKLSDIIKRRQKQKQAIQALSQATNYKQIRAALNQFTVAKGWGDNLALEKVPILKKENGCKGALLQKTINKLQAHQFSSQSGSVEITEIKEALVGCLKK